MSIYLKQLFSDKNIIQKAGNKTIIDDAIKYFPNIKTKLNSIKDNYEKYDKQIDEIVHKINKINVENIFD